MAESTRKAKVPVADHAVQTLPISTVYPNPTQPRKIFDPAKLSELAGSIKANGLMQPIVVAPRKSEHGDYMVIGGERRWRASKEAGCQTIAAIIRHDITDAQIAELALIENLNREDLQPIEEARAY